MKNNILKVSVLFLFLFVNVSVFAQADGPSQTGSDSGQYTSGAVLENSVNDEILDEPSEEPINSNMYLLAGAGVLVGGYFFSRKQLA